jgi:hypothetical protein
MRFNRSAPAAVIIVLLSLACAGGGAATAAGTSSSPKSSPNVLDSLQLREKDYGSVHQAILATHPDWLLAARGKNSLSAPGKMSPEPQVGVFINESHRSITFNELQAIKPDNVRSVRHLTASESRAEFGADWQWGAIIVYMLR